MRMPSLLSSLDRRSFLAGSVTLAISQNNLALESEPIPAIDVHTHFYDPTRPEGVPWPSAKDATLYRRVLPADFRKVTAGLAVAGTIVVEASPWLEDNQWLLELAIREREVLGVVGRLDLQSETFAKTLDRFAKNPLYRGIRIGHAEVKAALAEAGLRQRLHRLIDLQLCLDVNGGPDLPADAARLARLCPELRIIINHLGNPRIDGKSVSPAWQRGMSEAAAENQVYCKLSAVSEGARRAVEKPPESLNFYRPILDCVWKFFGAERLMYGSNWPVCEKAAPYAHGLGIVRSYLAEQTRRAAEQVLFRNAMTIYRLTRAMPKPG
jgi:L-fuconolactonase